MKTLDLIVILIYLLLICLVGFIGSKRAKTADDYIVAGRRLGFFMYFGCITAVILGGASTIGTSQLGYEYGISGMWLVTMLGMGILSIGVFLVKKIFGLKVLTISELLGQRYDSNTRIISAVVASIYALMVTVTQIIAIGTIVHVLLGWSETTSMLVVGLIVVAYTIIGGMWAVSMTDILQFVIMTIGIIFIFLPFSLYEAGGITGLRANLPASYFNVTTIGIETIIQYLFLFCLGIIVGQDIWQRVFTARSKQVARWGSISSGIYSVIYAFSVSIIGMCALVVLPDLTNSQLSFASLAQYILPSGLLGLVLSAVLAALMSTASGTLLASSTLISNDIIKKYSKNDISEDRFLNISRLTTATIGFISMLIALWIKEVLVALDIAYAILSGALFFPIILGLFWKKANSRAALISIIFSSIVIFIGLAVKGISSTDPIMYGLIVSFILMIAISLLSPKKEETESDDFRCH